MGGTSGGQENRGEVGFRKWAPPPPPHPPKNHKLPPNPKTGGFLLPAHTPNPRKPPKPPTIPVVGVGFGVVVWVGWGGFWVLGWGVGVGGFVFKVGAKGGTTSGGDREGRTTKGQGVGMGANG